MTGRDRAAGRGATRAEHGGPAWLTPMPVRDWMQPAPATVGPETTVRAAAALMRARNVRHLPVVDGGGRLVGIVTDRDLRQVVFDPAIRERLGEAAHGLDELPAREVMTWGVIAVRPATDLREAARLMYERRIGALPVTDGGRVVGILSETDVLRALTVTLRERLTEVRPLAGSPGDESYDYGFPPPVLKSNEGVLD